MIKNCLIILSVFFLVFIFHPHSIYSQDSSTYIETNVVFEKQRTIKLNDGTYWAVKLNHGFLWIDQTTGANWWRFDPVQIRKGSDKEYPYVIENLHNREVIACKQYDPALCSKNIITLNPQVPLKAEPNDNISIISIIKTDSSLFIQLSDSSYWKIMGEGGWFRPYYPHLSSWNRFDPVELKKSAYPEYPYILINLKNDQEVYCCQVDPAIPSSIYVSPKQPQEAKNKVDAAMEIDTFDELEEL